MMIIFKKPDNNQTKIIITGPNFWTQASPKCQKWEKMVLTFINIRMSTMENQSTRYTYTHNRFWQLKTKGKRFHHRTVDALAGGESFQTDAQQS